MSSKVIGQGRCPRCGRKGSVVLKEISGRIYVYVKHGREWHYIGPLEEVDLRSLLYHTTTTKNTEQQSKVRGAAMGGDLKSLLVKVGAVLLIIVGLLLIVGPIYAILTCTVTGMRVKIGGEIPIPRDSAMVLFIHDRSIDNLNIVCRGCSFRYCFDCAKESVNNICKSRVFNCIVPKDVVYDYMLSNESFARMTIPGDDIAKHRYLIVVPANYPAMVVFNIAKAYAVSFSIPILLFPSS